MDQAHMIESENPFPETHTGIAVQIFEDTQTALVRKDVSVSRFIQEILSEFSQELDGNTEYALRLNGVPLDEDLRIEQIPLKADDTLQFSYRQVTAAVPIPPVEEPEEPAQSKQLALKAGSKVFRIIKSSTLIGRPRITDTRTGASNVDIDLSNLPESQTVSRPHARITKIDESYRIESLKQNNMVVLNSKSIAPGDAATLQDGDTLQLGKVILSVVWQ